MGPRYQLDANTRLSGGGCLLDRRDWWTTEQVHQDVPGILFKLDLLHEQARELPPLVSGPGCKDVTKRLPTLLHESRVDVSGLAKSRDSRLPLQKLVSVRLQPHKLAVGPFDFLETCFDCAAQVLGLLFDPGQLLLDLPCTVGSLLLQSLQLFFHELLQTLTVRPRPEQVPDLLDDGILHVLGMSGEWEVTKRQE
jgi:hypothetical protein